MPQRAHNLSLLIILMLLGTALRFYGLSEMQTLLHGDEAYYGLDAVSLVENPRLQVYFPANTGREGLWMYVLAPVIALVGATPFAMRFTAALVGIVTLAAVYRLGRETLDEDAIWVTGALAVLYWHVQLSHIGFRVITMVLFGALAFAALLRAHRINRGWILAGALLGLSLYTYIAVRVYVGYAGLWLLWWVITDQSRRRGAMLSLVIMVLMAIPLGIALLAPAETSASIGRAAASDWGQIWQNVTNWANAWLGRGDVSSTHNLPNRPVLDIPLAILAIAGLIPLLVRRKWLILWWLGLVAVSLLPTVLSVETPHFLRGAGLILPLVLLTGLGAGTLSRRSYGWILVLGLIMWAGWNTYSDFGLWLRTETDDFGITYDYRVNEAMFILDSETPPGQPVIMPTGEGFRATAAYLAAGMGRDLTFYSWRTGACYLSPKETYTALDLPVVNNSFSARVLPYVADLSTIREHPEQDYNIYTVTPSEELRSTWEDAPVFGEVLSARVIAPTENTVSAGETLRVYWAMRLDGDLPRNDYRVLLHLQGEPTPYEGGTLYATGDAPLCDLATMPQAQGDVTIVQPLDLLIPDDLPAGDYHLAMGFYTPDDFTRLGVSPAENEHGYSRAWEMTVVE